MTTQESPASNHATVTTPAPNKAIGLHSIFATTAAMSNRMFFISISDVDASHCSNNNDTEFLCILETR